MPTYCLDGTSSPTSGLYVITIILIITMTILMIIAMIKMTLQQQIAFVKPLEVYLVLGNIIRKKGT